MAGRRLEARNVTDAERSELIALAVRPKTVQALAARARIILACAEGLETWRLVSSSRCIRKRSANGAAAFWCSGSRVYATSHGPEPRARLRMNGSNR
jgi:hypothetical protein